VPAEPVDARDTTGAGDAFNGALAASLALDAAAPFAAHLRFASRYAGAVDRTRRRRGVDAEPRGTDRGAFRRLSAL
jgi:ribokinase